MRPIRLTVQAFGPYAGCEVIDFTNALDAGVFGIYGTTGAGKTSVFDGISFALFGQSSGRDRTAEDMISRYAKETMLTEVELVFELGDKRYVAQRIPDQMRPAKRGEGTSHQLHEAYLFDATGMSLEEITSTNRGQFIEEKKVSAVDAALRELLGYDADQFRQIVLLPQGDFRDILNAKSEDRSKILRRLFDVKVYETIMERMRVKASTLRAEIEKQRTRRDTLLEEANTESLTALDETISERDQQLQEVIKSIAKLEKTLSVQDANLIAGEKLYAQFQELDNAKVDQDKLASQESTIEALRTRLKKATSAQSVLPIEQAFERAKRGHQEAAKRKDDADLAIRRQTDAYETAKSNHQTELKKAPQRNATETEIRTLEAHLASFGKVVALKPGVVAAKTTKEAAEQAEKDADAKLSGSLKHQKTLKSLLEQSAAHAVAVQTNKDLLVNLNAEARAADAYQAALTARNQKKEEVAKLSDAHAESNTIKNRAEETLKLAEQELSSSQSLHLAKKLEEGEACPVCGSLDHPAPAIGDPVSEGRNEAFEQARAALSSAVANEQSAATSLSAAQAVLAERETTLVATPPSERGSDVLVPLLREAKAKEEEFANDRRFDNLAERIADAEKTVEADRQHQDRMRKNNTKAQSEFATARSAYNTALEELPEGWRNQEKIQSGIQEATRRLDKLNAALKTADAAEKKAAIDHATAKEGQSGANADLGRKLVEKEGSEETYASALKKHNLTTESFAEIKPDIAQIEELEQTIRSHDQSVAANMDRVTRATAKVAKENRPDLEQLQQAKSTVDQKLTATRAEIARQTEALCRFNGLRQGISAVSTKITEMDEQYKPLGHLSELVNGNNDFRVPLTEFAIASMLDEILIAANQRLQPMTDGRYQLHRKEGTVGGRGKRGLDIEVFDENTQDSRSTTTLSGGEGFQAALALALGLSDVVQETSGGIKLDAIFIDEGFGSLDEGSLEVALDTLLELSGEKRVVGLISHTEMVKASITAGFDIEKTSNGSTVHARENI